MQREFDLELLINKKAVVNCKTKEEEQEFLNFLDSKNIKWISKNSIYDSLFDYQKDFNENTCFCLEDEGLSYSNKIYFIRKDYTILSLDDIVVEKKLNNFEEYGFASDFEGEILKEVREEYIGYVVDRNIIYSCKWNKKGEDLDIKEFNLTPIKKEWYENPDSRFKLVIYQNCLYTLSWWYRDANNVELIDIKKATTQIVNVKDVRPATQEEILTLLVKE